MLEFDLFTAKLCLKIHAYYLEALYIFFFMFLNRITLCKYMTIILSTTDRPEFFPVRDIKNASVLSNSGIQSSPCGKSR